MPKKIITTTTIIIEQKEEEYDIISDSIKQLNDGQVVTLFNLEQLQKVLNEVQNEFFKIQVGKYGKIYILVPPTASKTHIKNYLTEIKKISTIPQNDYSDLIKWVKQHTENPKQWGTALFWIDRFENIKNIDIKLAKMSIDEKISLIKKIYCLAAHKIPKQYHRTKLKEIKLAINDYLKDYYDFV